MKVAVKDYLLHVTKKITKHVKMRIGNCDDSISKKNKKFLAAFFNEQGVLFT